MAYSDDDDLEEVQKDILNLGVADWDNQHIEAEALINRDIRSNWFSGIAREKGHADPFDQDFLLVPSQFKRLSVYKVLELAYLFVMIDAEDGPFRDKMTEFKSRYEDELKAVFTTGITYDWNGSGSEDQVESYITKTPRTITR